MLTASTCMDSSDFEELSPAERSVIKDLMTTVDELRGQLGDALKKACDYMDKAAEVAGQVEKVMDIVTKMFDDLKEQVNNNLDLHRRVMSLELEVQLARKDAFLLRNEAMMLEKQCLAKKIAKDKKAQEAHILERERLEAEMARGGQ